MYTCIYSAPAHVRTHSHIHTPTHTCTCIYDIAGAAPLVQPATIATGAQLLPFF